MVDHISAVQRSALMARVRGRNTRPEIAVRSIVHRLGFRFRIGSARLPGNPDLVLPRHRKVVFVHGCFWHQHVGCPRSARPRSHREFWNAKLDRNVQRDQEVIARLATERWSVLIIWECELKDSAAVTAKLQRFLCARRAARSKKGVGRT
jgi:DNA mismatch endonuclease (patch repair protein)